MEFSEKLKKLRKENNYTQKGFADKLGIGYSTLGHYESGRKQPTQSVISSIAKNFPSAILWLLRDDEDISINQINPVADKGVNIAGSNSGNINIDNSKTTNIIESNISDSKSFIDDKLKDNIKKLHQDIYKIRDVEEDENKKRYFIWQRLNSYMGVTKYDQIRKEEYEIAERFLKDWIQNWKDASEYIKKLRKKIFDTEKNSNEYFNFLKKEFNTIYLKDLIKDELVYIVDFLESKNNEN